MIRRRSNVFIVNDSLSILILMSSKLLNLQTQLHTRLFPSYLLFTLLIYFVFYSTLLSPLALPDYVSISSQASLPFLSCCHRKTTAIAVHFTKASIVGFGRGYIAPAPDSCNTVGSQLKNCVARYRIR